MARFFLMSDTVGRSHSSAAIALAALLQLISLPPVWAATNEVTPTNPVRTDAGARLVSRANSGAQVEPVRNACLEGRRQICGRVMQVLPDGLVVDSGYASLLAPPFNQSWVVRGTVSAQRDPSLVEEKRPDALAAGLLILTDLPKRPSVKIYDYVVIRGYPAGERTYTPVPGVHKTLRRFSASLDRAVKINLQAREGSQKP